MMVLGEVIVLFGLLFDVNECIAMARPERTTHKLSHDLVPLLKAASQDIISANCFMIINDGSDFHQEIMRGFIPHLEVPILIKTRQDQNEALGGSGYDFTPRNSINITCKFKIILIADPLEAIEVVNNILRDPSLQKPIHLAFISFQPNRKFSQAVLESQPLQLISRAICIRPFKKGGKLLWEVRTHSPLQNNPKIRVVGVWNETALIHTTKETFYPRKFLNLNGSPLKVCSFVTEPYISQFDESQQLYRGIEISYIQMLGQIMNFTPAFYSPPGRIKWGVPLPNGTWTGLFGELQQSNAHIGVASLYYTRAFLPIIDMVYPHYTDCITLLTKKPAPMPRWRALVQPFQRNLWVASFIIFLIASLVPTAVAEVYHCFLPKKNPGMFFRKPGFGIFYTVQTVSGIMSTDDRSPWPIRICVSMIWGSFFLLVCGYRAYLTASLSLPLTLPPIDTLDQFLNSGLQWGGASGELKRLLLLSEDLMSRKIGGGFQILNQTGSTRVNVTAEMAYVDSRAYVEYAALATNLDHLGLPTLRPIKDCVQPYNIAVGLPKNSPLRQVLTRFTLRTLQSGLLQQWIQDAVIQSRKSAQRNTTAPAMDDSSLVLSIDSLQGAFYLYLMFLVPSLLAFVAERWICPWAQCFRVSNE